MKKSISYALCPLPLYPLLPLLHLACVFRSLGLITWTFTECTVESQSKKKKKFGNNNIPVSKCFFNSNSLFFKKINHSISHVSTTTVSCPKNKTICLPHIMVPIETIISKQTYQKIHFPGKTPICKDQQIDYFLLINNVRDFEKMSIPFLNNLFLNTNSLFEPSQSLLTNIAIVPAHVANDRRYKLCKKPQIAGCSRVQTIHTMRLL